MRPTHVTFGPSHLVPPATLATPKTCLLSIEDTTATRWISECCSYHMCGYSRFVCLRISIVASTWVCLRSRKSFDVLFVNTTKRQSLAVQLFDENLHVLVACSGAMYVTFVRHGENVCATYGARLVFLSQIQVRR